MFVNIILNFFFFIVVVNMCIGIYLVDWNVDFVKDNMEVRFLFEKIIIVFII